MLLHVFIPIAEVNFKGQAIAYLLKRMVTIISSNFDEIRLLKAERKAEIVIRTLIVT
jgi:hypothetical protein